MLLLDVCLFLLCLYGVVADSCWGFYGDDLDGMKHHVDPKYHAALEEAWSKR